MGKKKYTHYNEIMVKFFMNIDNGYMNELMIYTWYIRKNIIGDFDLKYVILEILFIYDF